MRIHELCVIDELIFLSIHIVGQLQWDMTTVRDSKRPVCPDCNEAKNASLTDVTLAMHCTDWKIPQVLPYRLPQLPYSAVT